MKFDWLKVRLDLVRDVGSDAAVLYAYLLQINAPRDSCGYSHIDSVYIANALGWSRQKINREREKLVQAGLLKIRHGVNQVTKPRYKVIR